ncbi:MAG TPA: tRNA (N6-isopentenyl adenosine(37)-C2)-methylthiotransferase MiaB, partial [Clostridiaceae bacterium]|nr:tRNA (N6-isopentenyl adenosine(37)-C2)-methylthiotransferase MiaB [Clostridiaceae bacterium]
MNEEDSETMAGILENMGYIKTDDKLNSDLIILNTCCVRENPENKVFGNLGALKSIKKKRPEVLIAVCGCMMQEKGMAETIKTKFPFVD